MPRVISFNYNWNNKLFCKYFSTLRAYNPDKYVIGDYYDVYLKEEYLGKVKLMDVRKFKSTNLNAFICAMDTGYSVEETKKILYRMYKKKEMDLHFLLLKWVNKASHTSIDFMAMRQPVKNEFLI